MAQDTVIQVERVSKKFCRQQKKSMVYGMRDILRNMVGLSSRSDLLRPLEFWAVNDVSFEVKRGETFGLIGPNGSGKTTVLKMLNGIFWPDKGRIVVRGKLGALIAAGAGFHPDLTGRENIYLNGAILGMNRVELNKKFDSIVEFSGFQEFLDTPVKHYSSGMYVRLGFAIAIHCDLDIFLVDEALAVGDLNFQKKCIERIKVLKSQGTTILFVSHSIQQMQEVCDRSIFLHKGEVRAYGQTGEVIKNYMEFVNVGQK